MILIFCGCSHEFEKTAKRYGGEAHFGVDNYWLMDFSDSPLTDEQFVEMCRETDLELVRRFWFSGTKITDAAFAPLKDRKDLEAIDASATGITDESIAQLVNSVQLTELRIQKTDVSNRCIPDLLTMKRLAVLYVYETNITPNGIRQLKQGLPNCIIWDNASRDAVIRPRN